MTAITDTTTAVTKQLKKIWTKTAMQKMLAEESPLYGVLPKDESYTGNGKYIPLQFGGNQNVSTTFSTAQGGSSSNQVERFEITLKDLFGVVQVSNKAIKLSRNDVGSVVRILDSEAAGVFNTMKSYMAYQLFRNGGGALGRMTATSNTGTPTVTLDQWTDIVNFDKGMTVEVGDTDGTTGAKRAGTCALAGVTRSSAGAQLTATGNWTAGIAAAVGSDYIFRAGDFGACVYGLEAWVPASAPGATAFCGVDRTQDTRLGGLRKAASGSTYEEAIIDAVMEGYGIHRAPFDTCVMNPYDVGVMMKELGSKIVRDIVASTVADVMYDAIVIHTPRGKIKVLADPYCQKGVAWLLTKDTWTIESAGQAPEIDGMDGNEMLKVYNDAAVEMRFQAFWNLSCNAPGWNMRLAF